MKIDRYKLSEDSTIDLDDAGDWVPYIQVSRLLGTFTNRDRFATAALAVIAARRWDHLSATHDLNAVWADEAYAIADAMMEARRK